ncbi:hypothetical protein HMPREF1051_2239, partial [Neisseria sicca VK64]
MVFDVVGHEAVTVGLGNLGLVRDVGHIRLLLLSTRVMFLILPKPALPSASTDGG